MLRRASMRREVVKARSARLDIVKEMLGSWGRRLWTWVERVEQLWRRRSSKRRVDWVVARVEGWRSGRGWARGWNVALYACIDWLSCAGGCEGEEELDSGEGEGIPYRRRSLRAVKSQLSPCLLQVWHTGRFSSH